MKYDIPIVRKDASIEQLIYEIDRSKFSTAFVIEENKKYISQISVYKLRRLLLSGRDCSDSVSSIMDNSKISLNKNEINQKKILKSIFEEMELNEIEFCPVLSKDCQVIDVYSKNDISYLIEEKFHNNECKQKIGYVNNVLVVGGAGYLGSVLVRELLKRGYFVRILDSFIYGKKSIHDLRNHPSLEILEGDFRNIETIVISLKDIDAVILLAAVVGDPASNARPTQTIETNYLAAQALASACKSQQINRFIYASTCSVYGKGDGMHDENSQMNPVSLYARTKIASEKSIFNMSNHFFSPTILRMATLYGYSPRMRFDLAVNTMTLKSFLENRIHVYSGKQWRPLIHVQDAVSAYIKCLESPMDLVSNQIYNVGSTSQNYLVIEIAKIIKNSLGNVEIEVEESNIDDRDYRVSFNKIENELDFKSTVSIDKATKTIYNNLEKGIISNPLAKVYYNHYFDSTEE